MEQLIFFAIIVIFGHYLFSFQRVLYKLSQEFCVPQQVTYMLLPKWVHTAQVITTITKFSLLIYIGMSDLGLAIGLFVVSACIHIFAPLFPSYMFFKSFYEQARYIQEAEDYTLGAEYINMLNSSRLF